jgi:hypothetical protein
LTSKQPEASEGGSDPTFFKGSFLIFLIFLPAFLLIILTLLLAMQYKQLKAFTSPNAVEMATVPKSPEAEAKVYAKVHAFFAADSSAKDSTAKGGTDTVVLSAEEINHLIRTSKSLSELNLDYHMDMVDTLLVARNSLPVTHLNGVLSLLSKVLHVRGYLNSDMRGYPSLEKGQVSLIPVTATMNGLQAPVSVLNRKGGIDPSEWVADRSFYDQAVARLAGIKVYKGSLLLIKRR